MVWGWVRENIIDPGEEKLNEWGETAAEEKARLKREAEEATAAAAAELAKAAEEAERLAEEELAKAAEEAKRLAEEAWISAGGAVIDGVKYIGDVDDGLLTDLKSGAHLTGDFVVDGANDVGNFFEYFGSISQQGAARQETVDRGPTGIVDESACNEMEYFEWNRDIGLCQVKNNEDLNSEDLFRECANVAGNVVFEGFDDDTIDQPQTSGSMFDVVGTFAEQGLKQIPELPMTNVEELQGLNTTATDVLGGLFESMTDSLSWREKMDDESWLAAYENMNREEAQAYANSKMKFEYKGKYRVKPEVGFPVLTNTRMADTKTNFVDAFRMCSDRCRQNIYPKTGGGLTTPHVDPEHYCRGFSIIYKPRTKTYTCEQYKTHDNSDTKWRTGVCKNTDADISGWCKKLNSIESNPEDDKLGNNSGLYWRVGGLDIEGATLNADTVEIPARFLENMPRPPSGVEDVNQYIKNYTPPPPPKPPPPPPPSFVSTNGRCGPRHGGDKRCPGTQCCSSSGLCDGSRGRESDSCYQRGRNLYGIYTWHGQERGWYDGIQNMF